MYYALNDNVYLVRGAQNGCIYDFNKNELYHINQNLSRLIDTINSDAISKDKLSEEENNFLAELVTKELIIMCEEPKTNHIEEIRVDTGNIQFAWIEITSKCNLKCLHCYNESECFSNQEMSYDDYRQVVDSLLKMKVKKIQLIGGEPFINRSRLREMLDYTVGKFDFIEIFTNGTLINEEWVSYLKENHIRIALSVYSYDADVHDYVTTVPGSHRITNEAIKKLSVAGVKYRVANIIMKDVAIGEKNTDLYTLSKKKDLVRMSGRASLNMLSDDMISRKLITKDTFSLPLNKGLCQRIISGHNCFASKIYISADKKVYPCVMERRLCHGEIKNNGISLNDEICNFGKNKVNDCKECEFRYTCFDCRPNALTADICAKPWYCTYNPQLGQWAEEEIFIKTLRNK